METTQLLSPYWKVIGFSVIKDIVNKPQKAQQLADLTEQSVRQLLVLTQTDTLPHLVLSRRRDIIEKIAQARKASIAEVLTQPRANLAKILALLLSQPVADVEKNAMDILGTIEPAMREGSNNRLEAWVALDITGIAIEILMLAADQEGSRKKTVRATLMPPINIANGSVLQRIHHACDARRLENRATQINVQSKDLRRFLRDTYSRHNSAFLGYH